MFTSPVAIGIRAAPPPGNGSAFSLNSQNTIASHGHTTIQGGSSFGTPQIQNGTNSASPVMNGGTRHQFFGDQIPYSVGPSGFLDQRGQQIGQPTYLGPTPSSIGQLFPEGHPGFGHYGKVPDQVATLSSFQGAPGAIPVSEVSYAMLSSQTGGQMFDGGSRRGFSQHHLLPYNAGYGGMPGSNGHSDLSVNGRPSYLGNVAGAMGVLSTFTQNLNQGPNPHRMTHQSAYSPFSHAQNMVPVEISGVPASSQPIQRNHGVPDNERVNLNQSTLLSGPNLNSIAPTQQQSFLQQMGINASTTPRPPGRFPAHAHGNLVEPGNALGLGGPLQHLQSSNPQLFRSSETKTPGFPPSTTQFPPTSNSFSSSGAPAPSKIDASSGDTWTPQWFTDSGLRRSAPQPFTIPTSLVHTTSSKSDNVASLSSIGSPRWSDTSSGTFPSVPSTTLPQTPQVWPGADTIRQNLMAAQIVQRAAMARMREIERRRKEQSEGAARALTPSQAGASQSNSENSATGGAGGLGTIHSTPPPVPPGQHGVNRTPVQPAPSPTYSNASSGPATSMDSFSGAKGPRDDQPNISSNVENTFTREHVAEPSRGNLDPQHTKWGPPTVTAQPFSNVPPRNHPGIGGPKERLDAMVLDYLVCRGMSGAARQLAQDIAVDLSAFPTTATPQHPHGLLSGYWLLSAPGLHPQGRQPSAEVHEIRRNPNHTTESPLSALQRSASSQVTHPTPEYIQLGWGFNPMGFSFAPNETFGPVTGATGLSFSDPLAGRSVLEFELSKAGVYPPGHIVGEEAKFIDQRQSMMASNNVAIGTENEQDFGASGKRKKPTNQGAATNSSTKRQKRMASNTLEKPESETRLARSPLSNQLEMELGSPPSQGAIPYSSKHSPPSSSPQFSSPPLPELPKELFVSPHVMDAGLSGMLEGRTSSDAMQILYLQRLLRAQQPHPTYSSMSHGLNLVPPMGVESPLMGEHGPSPFSLASGEGLNRGTASIDDIGLMVAHGFGNDSLEG
ncbi:hypothetical protein M427DRAFT_157048 [Gonapodya prolifera JEL478]|uniref:LisH domain-containing protein n=1 Tax=Gonapodya prolifera (strain JEL478) TaxID=1344416 RepID=A0A139A7U0_GONPJ|nr:hypothetical protein M427DRAFT_157048 [Gonapodya prolifera JEL478]|eukprot:KXS12827.1 hypothetical protein M427DRAFT_157048 [Gonapodya prolifera JEL478]